MSYLRDDPNGRKIARAARLIITISTRDVLLLLLTGWAVFTIYSSPSRRTK